MPARPALYAGSALCLSAVLHCAHSMNPPGVADAPIVTDAGHDADANEGGAGGAAPTPPETNHPDPQLVQKALDRSGTPTTGDTAAHGLRFEVVELGPNAPWGLAVVNRGGETMSVVFDPRLLTLEVEPPPDPKARKGARPPKPRVCRLPEELRPARADLAYVRELAPGRGVVEAFDPRLYCVPQAGGSPLVPGAKVTATFGWPPKTKSTWRGGKKVEERLPDTPPFVAAPARVVAADTGSDAPDASAPDGDSSEVVLTDTTPTGGVKELRGSSFELGPDYAPPPPPKTNGLVFELTQGSDAATESSATVTVRLSNHGAAAERVYLRRELVSLEVSSPDGIQVCDPGPDRRAPDRQGFTLLPPGGSVSLTSRLAEMCPQDAFARPGLYLVHATFDPDADGSDVGVEAFVGHIAAERPVTVRIRAGRLPFPGTRSLADVQVGSATQPTNATPSSPPTK